MKIASQKLNCIFPYLDSKKIRKFFESSPNQDCFEFDIGGDLEGLILRNGGKDFIAARDTEFKITAPNALVGKDGSGIQIEFRFQPSNYPHVIAENLKNSLKIFLNWYINNNQTNGLVFGYYRFSQPLGGHIHFGIQPNKDLVRKLDLYLAIPLLLISNPNEVVLRCKTSYGKLSDIRYKPWGFEYRTLGNFAINKQLTTEIFILAGLIADQYHNLPLKKITRIFKRKYYKGDKIYFTKNLLAFIKKNILTIAIKRFSNWGWALLNIIRFLMRIEQGTILISSEKNILEGWNLLPNHNNTTYKIIVNQDEYMEDMKDRVLKNMNQHINLDGDLLIYGVKKAHCSNDIKIFVDNMLYKKLLIFLGKKQVEANFIKIGKFGKANEYPYSIGLSYKLRKSIYEKSKDKKSINWLKIIQEVIKICVV